MEDSLTYPKCFDSQISFDEWKNNARMTGMMSAGYCADCSPSHKAAMLLRNRCENPTVMFERDSEGNLVGYIPSVRKISIPHTDGLIHKWLKPDEQPSIRYLGVSSHWHPMTGTFDRIPVPKKERR
jgi:hypothetical protein